MPEYHIAGEVCLSVEAVADLDEAPDEEYAANILKGGYYETSTQDIEVDVHAIERTDTLDHTVPDDLRDAYERHDTIAEAAEEFTVGYHAVRRRLIDAGIHEPREYLTETDEGGPEPEVVDDDPDDVDDGGEGVLEDLPYDVPDGLTVHDFEQAVDASRTLFDVCELLEWPQRGKVRSVLVALNLYTELPAPEGRSDADQGGRHAR